MSNINLILLLSVGILLLPAKISIVETGLCSFFWPFWSGLFFLFLSVRRPLASAFSRSLSFQFLCYYLGYRSSGMKSILPLSITTTIIHITTMSHL